MAALCSGPGCGPLACRVCQGAISPTTVFNEVKVLVTCLLLHPSLISRKFELPECLRKIPDPVMVEEEDKEEGTDRVGFVVHLNTHKR